MPDFLNENAESRIYFEWNSDDLKYFLKEEVFTSKY
jgi:hypothetical protein